ncbi:LysR family transcriptional regulator [Novosphingobium sp. 9]|uniref:LysR family transcriptional regulator n=1 Tax=Novosphingobium sp. 9 TaxID=2025349 RepID=UPI0021B4FE91|nr:LysR family transcriptional regulator [Novosphingobium sp. 9]
MTDRWEGIEEAVAIADCGSFVRAAERLGTSTSRVSRALAALEQRLGVQLFSRTTRAVALTDTGRSMVERFRRLIEDRNDAYAVLERQSEPQGLVRVTCSTALGVHFVAPVLTACAVEFPRLQVDLDLSNRVIDIVGEGFDLAIRTGTLSDSRLIRIPVGSRRFLTCAAPAYLARRGTPVDIKDLARHDCLTGSTRAWHLRVGSEIRSFRPRGRVRCDNGQVVADAAIAGLGICHLPEFYVDDALRTGRLVRLLDDAQAEDEPIWAVYPERRHLLPKVQVVIERLREGLRGGVAPTALP